MSDDRPVLITLRSTALAVTSAPFSLVDGVGNGWEFAKFTYLRDQKMIATVQLPRGFRALLEGGHIDKSYSFRKAL